MQSCKKEKLIVINSLTESVQLLLSSYAKGIQKQQAFTGNLFQQETKTKRVDGYLSTAFHYIHQNPFRAGLSGKDESWPHSPLNEYLLKKEIGLCKQQIASQFIETEPSQLHTETHKTISAEQERNLFQLKKASDTAEVSDAF